MDIIKTENYYRALNSDSLCSCNYCRNYYKEIKATYPVLSDYLAGMGGDVEKPFEAMPLEPYEGTIEYSGVQYIVIVFHAHAPATVWQPSQSLHPAHRKQFPVRQRHSLIILLRNMLQYPNLDEQTTSERKETIDSLGIICEGINAISDTSEDEIEKYYHRKNVELLNAIIEQWKERLKAFG